MLEIVQHDWNNDAGVLRAPCVDVIFSQDVRILAEAMIETMFAANGAGLAAPQVGHSLNMFVMRTAAGLERNTRDARIVINPFTIIAHQDPVTELEGCLSIPGFLGKVTRFPQVAFVYYAPSGDRNSAVVDGFEARVYQHEFDHLQGVLYIDKASLLYQRSKA